MGTSNYIVYLSYPRGLRRIIIRHIAASRRCIPGAARHVARGRELDHPLGKLREVYVVGTQAVEPLIAGAGCHDDVTALCYQVHAGKNLAFPERHPSGESKVPVFASAWRPLGRCDG